MNNDNRNTRWAEIFVDELARAGVEIACVAPGSRSTSLALALYNHPGIDVESVIDERGAGFFALGVGLETGFPAVVLTTSGTAGANLYPAVIEANQAAVPLIVITADRPPELRQSGANQTIDQVQMFGNQVRWFVDIALPEENPTPTTLRYLRTTANRAVALAADWSPPGPVHLNFPFRKPFEPTSTEGSVPEKAAARANDAPYSVISRGVTVPDSEQMVFLADTIRKARRGMIVCGPRTQGGTFAQTVSRLSRLIAYPIFADALSGLRFGDDIAIGHTMVMAGYDGYINSKAIRELPAPDVVLQFGGLPTSKALNDFLENLPARTKRISIQEHGTWHDDAHNTSHLIFADPTTTCFHMMGQMQGNRSANAKWINAILAAERKYWAVCQKISSETQFEGAILHDLVEMLPDDVNLVVANSNPVRHLDQYAQPQPKRITVYCNRGASGIDGTISTAAGIAYSSENPTVLVTGDLAFYHDITGLLSLKRTQTKMIVVLINNNGGGIFHRLPVSDIEPPFTELFLTPHGLDFSKAAETFGVEHKLVGERLEFQATFEAALKSERSTVIEVQTDAVHQENVRKNILKEMEA